MGAVSGKDGSITYASGYTTKVTSWTINTTSEEVDTTALGEKWETSLAGVKGWSGTYTALIDDAVLKTGTTLGRSTSGLALGRAVATAIFKYGDVTTPADGFTGSIFVSGIRATSATKSGAATFEFSFKGTSTLSTTT